jgi:hypothetical protein
MSWNRNPAQTDPLLTQSMRDDFPVSMEREIVDGGVREGRMESPLFPGLVWLAGLMVVGLAALLIVLWLMVPGFP